MSMKPPRSFPPSDSETSFENFLVINGKERTRANKEMSVMYFIYRRAELETDTTVHETTGHSRCGAIGEIRKRRHTKT